MYDDNVIRIYQAFDSIIADEAIKLGHFGENFKLNRMTWIKPSFLWMMYRSGWATKYKQERILAIDIKRDAFDYLVKNAVPSKYSSDMHCSMDEWRKLIKESDIICQWDPERDIDGGPLNCRSIQLGIRGDIVIKYVNEWICSITDITEYVKELNELRKQNINIYNRLPMEVLYKFDCD